MFLISPEEVRAVIRGKISRSLAYEKFLEQTVTNPETGNKVKIKTLKSKPTDSKAYKLYKQLVEENKVQNTEKESTKTLPPLFDKKKTSHLPKLALQKLSDPDALFKQAKKAHQAQVDFLSEVSSKIGATLIRGDQEGADFNQKGPKVIVGPMKERERSEEKVETKFGGDWRELTDVVRGSIAVDTWDELQNLVNVLEKQGLKLAEVPDDRFSNPTEAGYRDLNLKVDYGDGHVGELQLHLNTILEAKEKGHKFYEKARKISANAQKEGRKDLTEEEQRQVEEANAKMRDLYDDAWERAMGSKKASAFDATSRTASQTKYYWYKDAPAKWEFRKFPVEYVTKGGRVSEETVYDLESFFRHARPIQKREFDDALTKMGQRGKTSSLRKEIIKLAYKNPELRSILLPLVTDERS